MKNLTAVLVVLAGASCLVDAWGGEGWKTVFYKRGSLGEYRAEFAGGPDSTLRLPVRLFSPGSKARIWLKPMRGIDVQLSSASLAAASDTSGAINGKPATFLFSGSESVMLPQGGEEIVSDEIPVALKPGWWYLQNRYISPTFSYVNDADGFFWLIGEGQDNSGDIKFTKDIWAGNVFRIDVWSDDATPSVACLGDSITQGFGATPMSGSRYPEALAEIAKKPTINLGYNGDMAIYTPGIPLLLKPLDGVGTVIFLMGINDIINGRITAVGEYEDRVAKMVEALRNAGMRVILGTIPPAGGWRDFDDRPEKESLRQAINEWIRSGTSADDFVDFDEALRDPKDPRRMKEELQNDWLHPNDDGYRKMAEAAAAKLKN